MENISHINPLLKMAPLALLLIAVVWIVLRGLKRDADSTNNRESGGGPGVDHTAL